MIAEAISLITDLLPYGIGRAVIAVISLGRCRCEPRSPLFRTADSLKFPFFRRKNGRLLFTQQSAWVVGSIDQRFWRR